MLISTWLNTESKLIDQDSSRVTVFDIVSVQVDDINIEPIDGTVHGAKTITMVDSKGNVFRLSVHMKDIIEGAPMKERVSK